MSCLTSCLFFDTKTLHHLLTLGIFSSNSLKFGSLTALIKFKTFLHNRQNRLKNDVILVENGPVDIF